MRTIIDVIPTPLHREGATNGGEFGGPCPWCGGDDRFRVWPSKGDHGRYWCRQCNRGGDGINLLMELRGLPFVEAREALAGGALASYIPVTPAEPERPVYLEAPGDQWQVRALAIAEESAERLWTKEGARALAYLRGRGFIDEVIAVAGFGFNPLDIREDAGVWGLEQDRPVFVPHGITIPWMFEGEIWRLNVRRPKGNPKYIGPAGFSNGLYLGEGTDAGLPVVLVEGEFDAWSVQQAASGIARAVATGSTSGSQRPKWVCRLLGAPLVLVAFDVDENHAGETAARYWCAMRNAIRWAPIGHDVNGMLKSGEDVLGWINAGIEAARNLNVYNPSTP